MLPDRTANRYCDGDVTTADGGLGVLRFGDQFTLAAFEEVRAAIDETFGSSDDESARWVTGGYPMEGVGEAHRLALLLAGIDPSSLPFLAESP